VRACVRARVCVLSYNNTIFILVSYVHFCCRSKSEALFQLNDVQIYNSGY